MNTEIIKIRATDADFSEKTARAAGVISRGGTVVFPTETVYGLGADGTNAEAAKRIYEAKGRPSDNPLIIHIAEPKDAESFAYTSPAYYKLAEVFMPGPLTVIMDAKDTVPRETRGGLSTVAVRCPVNPIARELIRLSGVPIAAPSANISGTPSPTAAEHVIKDMTGRVDVIIDGGDCDFGIESTIVKINENGALTLLRPGRITPEDLSVVGFDVLIADAVTDRLRDGEVALSPGMKYRHYAPKASLILLDGDVNAVVRYISGNLVGRIACIAYTEDIAYIRDKLPEVAVYDFGHKEDTEEQARTLFSLLRRSDEEGYDTIYAPLPECRGIGLAIYNRMIRAAAHKIIRL